MINWLCYWFWFGHSFVVLLGVGSSWEPNASELGSQGFQRKQWGSWYTIQSLGRHVKRDFMMSESFQVDALTSRMCCNFAARCIYKQSPCSILKHHIFMLFMVFLQCMLQLSWHIGIFTWSYTSPWISWYFMIVTSLNHSQKYHGKPWTTLVFPWWTNIAIENGNF